MSADRKPHANSSLLGKPLWWVTWLVTRYPVATMVISGLLAAGAMVLAQKNLKFHTNRDNLLNPKSQYHRRWLEYAKEFGDQENVILVVTGENRQAIAPVLEELAGMLARQPRLFQSLFYKVDRSKLLAKGLHRRSVKELQEIEGFLNEAQPVLRGDWASMNVGGQLAWFCKQLADGDPQHIQGVLRAAQREQIQGLETLDKALGQTGPYQSPWPMVLNPADLKEQASGPQYIFTNGERVGMIMLWLTRDDGGNFAQYADSIGELRRIVGNVKARHPEAWIGLTGLPVMENDEMESMPRP